MKFNIFFIRFQDFDQKTYISSEIELNRAFYENDFNAKLFALGNIPRKEEFIHLIKKRKPLFLSKIILMFLLFKNRNMKSVYVFDSFSIYTSFLLIIYRSIFGAKYKLIHDIRTIPVETFDERKIDKFKRSLLYSHCFFDGYTFITNGVKEESEKMINKRFIRYSIIPSGTNTNIFKKQTDRYIDTDNFKNNFTVFYHGTLTKNRGIIETLKAVEELNNDGKNIKLLIVGEGDRDIIEMIKQSKYAIFWGKKKYEKIPDYIALANICIVPLPNIVWWRVSSPLKLMEYMACEKPILLTNIDAHRFVYGNKSLYYMDNIEVETIKKGIIYMKEHYNDYIKHTHTLREIIINNFSYAVLYKNAIAFYKSLL